MKKFILIILLLLTGIVFAQPNINQPDDLLVCDDNLDGFIAFDLTVNEIQTLNGLNPTLYTINYYETLADSQAEINPLAIPSSYVNTSNPQTIYVRVEENADPSNFALTSFDIIVNLPPNITQPSDIIIYEYPYNSFGVFDLTSIHNEILNGIDPSSVEISHYVTLSDAVNNVAAISNPLSFNNTTPEIQQIYVAVLDLTLGCRVIESYNVIVLESIVFIPDTNFKTKLLDANIDNEIAQNLSDSFFKVDANDDGEIQFSEALAVSTIDISNSNISDLMGIAAFTNLVELDCDNNNLTQLDISQNFNLQKLFCLSNQLTSLDVTQNVDLLTLSCANNLLTEIDVSQNLDLEKLYCYFNQINTLDTSNNVNLQELWCMGNQLTFLDVTQNENLVSLQCQNNQLTVLLIKNGSGEETLLNFGFNPDLVFICADEFQINGVRDLADVTTVVSSYCSFTPGGDYNTITGMITYDGENDGCDSSDNTFPFIKVNINDGSEMGSTFTNEDGIYTFYTQEGNFLITPDIENPTFFNVTPTQVTLDFLTNDNGVATQDFCITADGVHPDLEIVIAPIFPARPGFDANYLITYKNKGNQTQSGDITLSYNAEVMDYVSSTQTPTSQTGTFIDWSYLDLLPFESRSIEVTFNVNSPAETPAVNIGDILNFIVLITPTAGDELPEDNTFDYDQTVVGSYDPNDITCLEGDAVAPTEIGNYLHYIINFENTGTATAENVVVRTDIDPTMFDVNSLRLLSSSHDAEVKVTNNIVEIIFQTINLESGGHGNILLKMLTKSDLPVNSTVSQNAKIFFDYNFPIDTNDANTTFAVLSISEFGTDTTINIYPNPVRDIMNISAKSTIKNVSIYDLNGRILQSTTASGQQVTIDMSSQATGMYFVKITSDEGVHVEKIIKN